MVQIGVQNRSYTKRSNTNSTLCSHLCFYFYKIFEKTSLISNFVVMEMELQQCLHFHYKSILKLLVIYFSTIHFNQGHCCIIHLQKSVQIVFKDTQAAGNTSVIGTNLNSGDCITKGTFSAIISPFL